MASKGSGSKGAGGRKGGNSIPGPGQAGYPGLPTKHVQGEKSGPRYSFPPGHSKASQAGGGS